MTTCRRVLPRKHVLEMTGEFPKIRGTLFWGPYNEDPIIGMKVDAPAGGGGGGGRATG